VRIVDPYLIVPRPTNPGLPLGNLMDTSPAALFHDEPGHGDEL
jgi:hypothetical protein